MIEKWKDIDGYDGAYQISNFGRVKSIDRKDSIGRRRRGNIMTPIKGKTGYLDIHLTKNGKSKTYQIHRLVAIAFLPPDKNKPIINHKDENPHNNHADNLEWCDYKYNANYGKMTHEFRSNNVSGEKHPRRKLTKNQVENIRKTCIKGDKNCGITALSRQYGICERQIRKIVNNQSWIE